jgi:hypothetical protein
MGEPESFEPSEAVGRQLRRFFLELLDGTNLQEFRRARGSYIAARRPKDPEGAPDPPEPGYSHYLGPEAAALLDSDDLKRIEAHINAVTGSNGAIIICVVFPPI